MSMIGGRYNLDVFLEDERAADYSFNEGSDFVKITDRIAVTEIKERFNIKTTTIIRSFTKEKRDEAIRWLKFKGYSVRQIERLTGVGRGEIQNIR